MACGCKSKKQEVRDVQPSMRVTPSDVKIQEQQNKRIVDAIMTKLSV